MELKGSKTEANLLTAFAGESQARNKYTYFASTAKSEGYQQIGAIFEETLAAYTSKMFSRRLPCRCAINIIREVFLVGTSAKAQVR